MCILNSLVNNNFKSELIVIAHTLEYETIIISKLIEELLQINKKYMVFSSQIIDVNSINDFKIDINKYNADIIIIDNLQLLSKVEEFIRVLKTICIVKNIPIIIIYHLEDEPDINFSKITIFDLMPKLNASLIQDADLFSSIYKCDTDYKLKILKNRYGDLSEKNLANLYDNNN